MYRRLMETLMSVALILTACGSGLPNSVQLIKTDNSKTVDLANGGTLEIMLDGNPTTGYSWVLLSGNDAVLKPPADYTFKTDNPNLLGAGGKFTFKFQAINAGSVLLKFGYQRPWEKDVAPIETFSVTVKVK